MDGSGEGVSPAGQCAEGEPDCDDTEVVDEGATSDGSQPEATDQGDASGMTANGGQRSRTCGRQASGTCLALLHGAATGRYSCYNMSGQGPEAMTVIAS